MKTEYNYYQRQGRLYRKSFNAGLEYMEVFGPKTKRWKPSALSFKRIMFKEISPEEAFAELL